MNNGTFISFEGGEGSGKSTIIPRIAARLEAKGYDTLVSREPGGVASAEKIRHLLLDDSEETLDLYTEVLLFAAARRQHLVEKIIPALEAGKIVLCDRYVDSSLVYQGHAAGAGIEEVREINLFAIRKWLPHRTFFLDIPINVGFHRIAQNARAENRLDQMDVAFHELVRDGYHILVNEEPERYRVIQANTDIARVEGEIFTSITEML
ncbi:dTMP kinase [Natribacillus halophilus]|uniref:Thymidylate kinase n=1 Tax=Natribacillus halophilus TaxID=549003 RepID=A0A1G8SXP0_9BACI|nr:dTMP kinase [Natribacillus halophilus]SDJ33330.1 thymidylate kinase [Natribacillus halophilus]